MPRKVDRSSMGEAGPTRYFRYRREMEDEKLSRYSRRFLGADFLLVLLFLAIVFYFFFPQLFNPKRLYAPETAVNNTFLAVRELQTLAASALPELGNAADRDGALAASLRENVPALESKYGSPQEPMHIYLLARQGERPAGAEPLPATWKDVPDEILRRERGAIVRTGKSKGTLLLFEKIAGTDLFVLAAQEFPPIFQVRKEEPAE